MSDMELDANLLQDFITESKELLEDYTSSMSAFEADPQNLDTINPVFRAAHTLKGSSAFFGLNHIKDFAHKLENLLDDIRHGTRQADPKAIEYLFLAGNHLKAMFDRLSDGDARPILLPEEEAFQKELVEWMGQGGGGGPSGQPDFEGTCVKIKALIGEALDQGGDPDHIIQSVADLVNALPLADPAKKKAKPYVRPQSVAFGSVDFSEPLLAALDDIYSEAFDPKAFDADLKLVGALIKDNSLTDLEPTFKEAMEDFTAVFESGLDFDPILVGLIRDKLTAFLAGLTVVYPEAAEPEAEPAKA
ncbi:MAG: Hpt domain-containing protein, partial [Deltaproteobacteria bacterium]|nr:Hpt domain-containing protein [Deltaproteobacteria bacterium]